MNPTAQKLIRGILTPLSWIYGAVVWVRNKMFDMGILPQETFPVPVVCIGNITVGGTGKTPHTEYVVSCLAGRMKMAVLSRGYKRKTRGFILANSHSTPELIGDEPLQIYRKFRRVAKVAVCENRREGIRELLRLFPDLELVILDDAFQHRYVKPSVAVLLTEYNRPVHKDHLLPLGRLRESTMALNRADIVVVTKCPDNMSALDVRLRSKDLDLMSYQKLFFSRYTYGPLEPVFAEDCPYQVSLDELTSRDGVLLVTGIAHPRYFVRHFSHYPFKVKVDHFPDHHDFSRADIEEIAKRFKALPGERKIIITTEKDAVRLAYNPYFPPKLKPFVFYQPIAVNLEGDGLIQAIMTGIGRGEMPEEHTNVEAPTLSGYPPHPGASEEPGMDDEEAADRGTQDDLRTNDQVPRET